MQIFVLIPWECLITYLNHIHHQFLSYLYSDPPPTSWVFFFPFWKYPINSNFWCPYNHRCEVIHWSVAILLGLILFSYGLSFIREPAVAHICLVRSRDSWAPSHSMLECWLKWSSGSLFRQPCLLWVYVYKVLFVSRRHCFSEILPDLWFLKTFNAFFFGSLRGNKCDENAAKHSTDTYPVHSD